VTAHNVLARIALPLAAVAVIACVAMLTFGVVSLFLPGNELLSDRPSIADFFSILAIVLVFPIVGLVIASRRPGNPVGWLFLVVGLVMALDIFGGAYSERIAFAGASLPGGAHIAWLSDSFWILGPAVALPVAIALFPDGRMPGSRWRLALIVAVTVSVVVTALGALAPGDLLGYGGQFVNPFGVRGEIGRLALWASRSGGILQLLPAFIAIAAIAVRLRRARGAERQQLKWLLFPLAVFVLTISTGFAVVVSVAPASADDFRWIFTVALVALGVVPLSAGIAILRYRLYDIDVVIRRTLVYGVVVAILGGTYIGLVLGLQALLRGLTGGETIPVALSTLMIAALFVPVRTRVRQVVDRRFYRSRYDAQRTVESFAGRIRDEVELEAVGQVLATTVGEAVRPASIGVWLRARGP
jgi:hypothetical protein